MLWNVITWILVLFYFNFNFLNSAVFNAKLNWELGIIVNLKRPKKKKNHESWKLNTQLHRFATCSPFFSFQGWNVKHPSLHQNYKLFPQVPPSHPVSFRASYFYILTWLALEQKALPMIWTSTCTCSQYLCLFCRRVNCKSWHRIPSMWKSCDTCLNRLIYCPGSTDLHIRLPFLLISKQPIRMVVLLSAYSPA